MIMLMSNGTETAYAFASATEDDNIGKSPASHPLRAATISCWKSRSDLSLSYRLPGHNKIIKFNPSS